VSRAEPAIDVVVRAVAFREGDLWVVQGIDYDIAATAADPADLPGVFARAVMETICVGEHLGRKALQGVKPAPPRFAQLWDAARSQVRAVDATDGLDIRLVAA
jgi:hypothetical protein